MKKMGSSVSLYKSNNHSPNTNMEKKNSSNTINLIKVRLLKSINYFLEFLKLI